MIRINVVVEGQTEETFVRQLLVPYFTPNQIFMTPIQARTSRTGRGRVVSYGKIKHQIQTLLESDQNAYVSTMFDLYRLPTDFPGMQTISRISDPLKQADHIEKNMTQDLTKDLVNQKFIANITVHEFEALLYSDPSIFSFWFTDKIVSHLVKERSEFQSPEHINNSPDTAPSRRILKACQGYDKVLHGASIASRIGLTKIRQECMHFNNWMTKLSALPC